MRLDITRFGVFLVVVVSAVVSTMPSSEAGLASTLEPPPNCRKKALNSLINFIKESRETMKALQESLGQPQCGVCERPKNCQDLLDSGDSGTGLRVVYPDITLPHVALVVFCDQVTDGGGWTVLQRRDNLTEREDFERSILEYRLGFGCPESEFWLGLEHMHTLTSHILQELRVDLWDYDGEHRWAKYEVFYIGPASTHHHIHINKYIGTAGDGLVNIHHSQPFTTSDHVIKNFVCAQKMKGGWWYGSSYNCADSNLNGRPLEAENGEVSGVVWVPWLGIHYSLRKTAMMTRPSFRSCKKP